MIKNKLIITKTPLRLSFFGGGSDIGQFYTKHKGSVISSSINKYVYVTVKNHGSLFDEKYRINYQISENTNKRALISVLGGGDTISAVNKKNNKFSFTHLSTAGGAFLEYLEGKDLPGLSVLK